jgi:hypothetical protein
LIQDFIAPVYLFLKADYTLEIKKAGDILSSGDMQMISEIRKKITGKETEKFNFYVTLKENGIFDFEIHSNDLKIKMICRNE